MEVAREITPAAAAEPGHHEALRGWAALAETVADAAAVADAALDTDDASESRRMVATLARLLRLAAADARAAMGLPEAEASPA